MNPANLPAACPIENYSVILKMEVCFKTVFQIVSIVNIGIAVQLKLL
jgi:hypothetical protein